jgi:hypothetical protein
MPEPRLVEFAGGPFDGNVMTVETNVVYAMDEQGRTWLYSNDRHVPGPWPGRLAPSPLEEFRDYVRPASPPPLPRAFRIANRLLRPLGLMLLPGDGRL